MKILLTILLIVLESSSYGQCFIPLISREAKKIEIGASLLKIHTSLNLVEEMTEGKINDSFKIVLNQKTEDIINQKVNKYLFQNQFNTNRFNFKALELYQLNNDSIKFYSPILAKEILADELLYCDGQVYLEKNVVFDFPIILDNRYNIVFADFNKVGKINENIISICEAYFRLTNSDSKTTSLDIDRISIENSQNHSFLIFELSDY